MVDYVPIFCIFHNLLQSYKFYLSNIHFHNTDTLITRNIRYPRYLRIKQTKLNFKIAIICIYLLNI